MNGLKNGIGKEYDSGKLAFKGEYLNDEKNGNAIKYNRSDKLISEGNYIKGQKQSKCKEYKFDELIL